MSEITPVISATGLYTPPETITNDELVASYNAYVELHNARHAAEIAAGTVEELQPSSAEFIEKASGIKSRHVMSKAPTLDPETMGPRWPERSNDELSVMAEIGVKAALDARQDPDLMIMARTDALAVNGLDDAIDIPARRDRRVQSKADKLMKQLLHWFPRLDPVLAFSWAGTFAETADGLPFFGPHDQWGPRVHFAMAYGGNGITYSVIASQIVGAAIRGKTDPDADLYAS